MSFYAVSALVNFISAFIFGILVFLNNRKAILNIKFFLMSLVISLWSVAYLFWQLSESYYEALFWVRLFSIASTFIPIFYVHWVLTLIDEKDKRWKYFTYFFYAVIICLISFILTEHYIFGLKKAQIFFFWPKPGVLYSVSLVIFFFLILVGIYKLIRAAMQTTGQKRTQIYYILFGSVVGFSGGATNFFLWYDIPIKPFGNIFVSFYTVILAYAIVRHRLMDIKFVMRRYTVFLGSLFVILVPAILVKYYFSFLFPEYSLAFEIGVITLAISAYPSVRNRAFSIANKYFFSSLYDSSQVIAEISGKLRSTLNLDHIYDYIYSTLNNAMHIKSFGVLRFDEEKKLFSAQYNEGFEVGRKVVFPQNSIIQRNYIEQNIPFIVSEMNEYENDPEVADLYAMLKLLKVEILLPLNIKDKVVGLLALGPKESGDMYNDEDLQVLSIISAQSAIAIENAELYLETRSFGEKMEEEVKKATSDLRRANERLKKLDAAKSEFISIASHQLRTPLTVIKGYISMMAEGSFGKISPKIKDSLEKVYESNERLISLVENLLNISRIESGRLKFSYKTIQLEDMIESVCEELYSKANEKSLKLEFKRLKNNLPTVTIDTEKVRQVVMNLIDNSIKYTPKGKVTVTLKKQDDQLLFCVADKGLGISAEDIPTLFKKFARGSGAKLEHTEGTGLGLFVARQMIEAHKGKVWAESPGEGKGSKFCFLLPYDKEKKDIKKSPPKAPSAQRVSRSHATQKKEVKKKSVKKAKKK